LICAWQTVAMPAASFTTMCARSWQRISGATLRDVHTRSAVWLPIVPLTTNMPASLPRSSAERRSSSFTVGSSPHAAFPTSARAIASRISGVGFVTVSERRSTTCMRSRSRNQ
jgi:hypothetical protein